MANTYLNTIIGRIGRASQEAGQAFGNLSASQLNWKPSDKQWSIGQCLDHLIVSNCAYFPQLKACGDNTRQATFWERLPLLPKFWGYMLLRSITPLPSQKMRAPGVFKPSMSAIDADIVALFKAHNQELIRLLHNTRDINHDAAIITSPASAFVVYSLRDAINILANHEERHLLQARRVMENEGFPGA